MIIAAIGSTCLGIVVGWIVRYFLFRFNEFNAQILGSTISFVAGGVVVGFFSWVDPDKTVVWFYPIGLLIGFIIYSVTALVAGAPSKGGIYYSSKKQDD